MDLLQSYQDSESARKSDHERIEETHKIVAHLGKMVVNLGKTQEDINRYATIAAFAGLYSRAALTALALAFTYIRRPRVSQMLFDEYWQCLQKWAESERRIVRAKDEEELERIRIDAEKYNKETMAKLRSLVAKT